MGYTAEGTIEIPLEEFWDFVTKNYSPTNNDEIRFGVPRVNKSNQVLEIDFAFSNDTSPDNWSVKPDCLKQWDELKEVANNG
jgi:hypothetical protein